MSRIYLDYNASAPLRVAARSSIEQALACAGNPSSVHENGRILHGIINDARDRLARQLNVDGKGIVFTSGATEANNFVLSPRYRYFGQPLEIDRLIISATEHPSVTAGGRFKPDQVDICPVDKDGVIDLDTLAQLVAQAGDGQLLVSVMLVNNETGVIQPIADVAAQLKGRKALLHVDATQALGKLDLDLDVLGADFLTLSGHKIGGGWGAGAVVARSDSVIAETLIRGGGQEFYHRSGTENAAAIAGFAAALSEIAGNRDELPRILALRDCLEAGLRTISSDIVIFSKDADRVGNTCCFAVPNLSAETAMIALDLQGIAISSGSACSSGKVGTSPVLAAMGVDDALNRAALRVSLGWGSTQEDIDKFLAAWRKIAGKMDAAHQAA